MRRTDPHEDGFTTDHGSRGKTFLERRQTPGRFAALRTRVPAPSCPPHGLRPGDGQSRQQPQDFSRRILRSLRPDVSPSHENDDATSPAERPAHRGLLRTQQPLIETAGRLKCLAGAEEEATARESQGPIEGDRDGLQESTIEWEAAVEAEAAPAAHCTLSHRLDRQNNHAINHRIGVHEDQQSPMASLAPAFRVAAIWRMTHRTTRGPVLPCDGGGAVCRGIVHDHDLERLPQRPSGDVQRG